MYTIFSIPKFLTKFSRNIRIQCIKRSEFIDKFVDGEHFSFPAETHHLHEFLLIVNRFVGLVQHAEGSQPATGCHVSDLIGRVPDQVFLKNQLFRYVFLGQRGYLDPLCP